VVSEPSTSVVPGVPRGDLLGRDAERGHLRELVRRSARGPGCLVLIAGEPGIGKSSLAADAVAVAAAEQLATVWATCWQGPGTPAFWPWLQVLRHVRRTLPAEQVADAFLPVQADLGPLGREVMGGAPATGDTDRFRVFDALAQGLGVLAGETPLCIVLDDLHWADPPSIELLDFAAQQLHGAPVLFLGTYRDVELEPEHPLRMLVGRPAAHIEHLQLRGLDADDVEAMLRSSSPDAPDTLVEQVARDSGGNPFFVRELVRLLASGDGARGAELPHNVRQVVRDRVARLPAATVDALEMASVVGVTFSAADLGALSGVGDVEALHRLEPAVAARLVRSDGHTIRFVHALVPEVLYDDVPRPRRAELHARHARRIEASVGERLDTRVDELAFHWTRAVPVVEPSRAVGACVRAAEHALEQLAHEQAAVHYARAVELDALTGDHPAERAVLLHQLARAQNLAGAPLLAVAARDEAARLARRAGRADLLVEIGLETGEPFVVLTTDPDLVAILEDALAGLPPDDTTLRARAMAGLGTALLFTAEERRKETLFRDAVAMSRRLGDPSTLARVLAEQVSASRAENAERRLAAATEVVALAEQVGDRRLGLHGRILRVGLLVELADGPALRVELDAFERLAAVSRLPVFARVVPMQRAALATLAGDWAEAERLLDGAAQTYQRSRQATGAAAVAISRRCLRMAQGRAAELVPELERTVERFPDTMSVRAAMALASVAAARTAATRAALRRIGVAGLAGAPRDFTWVAGVALAGQAAVAVGDQELAAAASELLAPHATSFVTFSRTGLANLGPVGFTLGLTAEAAGRLDDAVGAYEVALATCAALGAPVFAADVAYALARTLVQRGGAGDGERAALLAANAAEAAERFGVQLPLNGVAPLAADWRRAGAGDGAAELGSGSVEPEHAAPAMAVREGDVWALTFDGATVRVRHTTGIGHLARLLARPGEEVHVLDLAGGGRAALVEAAGAPLLDASAKAAYRARVQELQTELDEATEWNDTARAARAQAELDALLAELSRATGLGGRDRKTPGAAERARFAVTKALRTAIRRIGEHHPVLGEHLDQNVRTGTFCAYAGTVEWDVRP
jgi:tetratricopeptide (TPR) repeat protein